MYLSRLVILGAVAIMPAGAQVDGLGVQHGRARGVHVRPDGSIANLNWAGYVVDGPDGSVTDVKGSWTIPAVTCPASANTNSSFWVGIDGSLSNTVEQIGTSSNCVGGTPHQAWFEFYPSPEVVFDEFPVQAGDQISAEVKFAGGMFTLTITDVTANATTGTTAQFPSALLSSAEWIAEDPSSANGPILPFASFEAVNFGADNTGVANTCTATVGTHTGTIGSFSSAAYSILDGASQAVPSALSPDGLSFSVTTQPFTTLYTFSGTDGATPEGLLQGLDGNLYGTTAGGGTYSKGTVFRVSTGGSLTTLYNFSGMNGDGATPAAGLTLGNNGDFYGTTERGGDNNGRTVLQITPLGILTRLWLFDSCYECGDPTVAPIQRTDGDSYEATTSGGGYHGSVFKLTPAGVLTTL